MTLSFIKFNVFILKTIQIVFYRTYFKILSTAYIKIALFTYFYFESLFAKIREGP